MASVALENISKIYPGDVRAVRNIDLEIQDGEFLVLVGPSGCGKSTTLRMVAGLETISDGILKIGDRVVNEIHPKDRDIAMVFQNYALYPHMTVRQNMSFALKMRKTSKPEIEERVHWAAEMLGLNSLLERKPKALSGGQRQRVALRRAIVRKPAVFLFDEPLSNLDAKLRIETRAEIKRLHRELKTTTLYVTHDQEEAMTLGDRVVVMQDGLIRQIDTPLNIYKHPADSFVASFLGMPPMNFLKGEIILHKDQLWFAAEGVRLCLDKAPTSWLEGATQRAIVAGIRPESFSFSNNHAELEKHSLSATVQVIEPLGSTMDVYLQTSAGNSLICRTPVEQISENEKVTLYVSPQDIHLFEPDKPGNACTATKYGHSLRSLQEQLA